MKHKGITAIEVLVVIAILGILASIVIPAFLQKVEKEYDSIIRPGSPASSYYITK